MKNTGASGIVYRSTILVFQYCKCTILVYTYTILDFRYCIITIPVFLVLYSVTILVLPVQYWYFQYCKYYNTGISSIVNITLLVIPVSWPAASYYPYKSLIWSQYICSSISLFHMHVYCTRMYIVLIVIRIIKRIYVLSLHE
jgi:hypothetical protein